MEKVQPVEELHSSKKEGIPDCIGNDIGQFNVFRLDPFVGPSAKPVPYRRRDYFKISLIIGTSRVHYADKVIEVQKQALVFTNPQIPYSWERIDTISGGFFCVFRQDFFPEYSNLNQYAVFQPSGTPVFERTDEQANRVTELYERMFEEIESDYIHKYDVLRNLVRDVLHFAMKMQPSAKIDKQPINASQRISMLFLELLERQFPIDHSHQRVELRTASQYAGQLNIHVNHLNRAVRETTQKTTTQIIAERILREAKILLKHTTWPVADISHALGFNELTHFDNFFKKHLQLNPLKFRND